MQEFIRTRKVHYEKIVSQKFWCKDATRGPAARLPIVHVATDIQKGLGTGQAKPARLVENEQQPREHNRQGASIKLTSLLTGWRIPSLPIRKGNMCKRK